MICYRNCIYRDSKAGETCEVLINPPVCQFFRANKESNLVENRVMPKIAGEKFNVICYATHDPNDTELYTHWAKDLTMLISKNGQSIKLTEKEIQELVKCLPKTVGGKY